MVNLTPPHVTIATEFPTAILDLDDAEGLTFTLTRTGPTTEMLDVGVRLHGEATDHYAVHGWGQQRYGYERFRVGSRTVSITLQLRRWTEQWEEDADVEMSLHPGDGYTAGTEPATVRIISKAFKLWAEDCQSSKQMGLLSVFHKGGSGSSLFDVKPLGFDGSSGGFGWSVF